MPLINIVHKQIQARWQRTCWCFVKGRKQFEEYPFPENTAFALEELSIYSEVIISEWKMFVQEGKALRSAESSLTHMLSTPLDSSA